MAIGISEVNNTINRLRYIRAKEDMIKYNLENI